MSRSAMVSAKATRGIAFLWFACNALIWGQSNPDSQVGPLAGRQPGAQQPLQTAQAFHVDHAPRLDGTLNDPLWQQATSVTGFSQREPFEGQEPTEKTEVRVLYTKSAVFFGVTCFDSSPAGIVATELRRDVSQELDDYFEIIIDSAHDRRNAYVFQVNPLGTQRDALITEEQRTDTSLGDGDAGWDGVWTSEARVERDGWTLTVGIPFATLNFMQSRDVIWGINFKRFIRRKNEEDLWSGWRRMFGSARISQAGELHGISDIGSGRLFIVKPYALTASSFSAGCCRNRPYSGTERTLHGRGRCQARTAIKSCRQLHSQYRFRRCRRRHPTVQLDSLQAFFPEKRQFFLENAGVFNSPSKENRTCSSSVARSESIR